MLCLHIYLLRSNRLLRILSFSQESIHQKCKQDNSQGSCKTLISKFKELSRAIRGLKQTIKRSFNTTHERKRKPKIPKKRAISWHFTSVNARIFFKLFGYLFYLFWHFHCYERSKQQTFTNFKALNQFQRKNFPFKKFQVFLKRYLKFQQISMTCTRPGIHKIH